MAKFLRKLGKIIVWTMAGLVLVVAAVFALLYSPWSQDLLRQGVVAIMTRSGMHMSLDSLALTFPATIDISGLSLSTPDGMTVDADRLKASVNPLGLIKGNVDISSVRLYDGGFAIGSPDSAMYLQISGNQIELDDATVGLAQMSINVSDATIRGARVKLALNPDTATVDSVTPPTQPTQMQIHVRNLALDDFAYSMKMLPVIDSLGAAIPTATVKDIDIDLLKQTIGVEHFIGHRLDAAYIAPDSATIAAVPVAKAIPTDTAAMPWTIRIDSIGFDDSHALYTTQGVKPLPGLDFAYIEASDLSLGIKDFYNQEAVVRVPLSVKATERCGVTIDAAGSLNINADGIGIDDFKVRTPNGTDLDFTAKLGSGDMTTDPSVPLGIDLTGGVAMADARMMFPAFSPYFATLPATAQLNADIDIAGTSGLLKISQLGLSLYGIARIEAAGAIENAFDPDRLGGHISLDGALLDINRFKPILFDKATAAQFNFPITHLSGDIDMSNGTIDGNINATTGEGDLALDGKWNSIREDYTVDLALDRFPVNAFMPLLGVGDVSAKLTADGHGYNPFVDTMSLNADLKVTQAVFNNYNYSGIELTAALDKGNADINLHSSNANAMFDVTASGNLSGATYDWKVRADGDHINLEALGLSTTEAVLETQITGTASMTPDSRVLAARVIVESLSYTDQITTTSINNVVANLNANDSVTNISVYNRDLYAFLSAEAPLDTLINRFSAVGPVIDSEIADKTINVERIQRALPQFTLDISGGTNNILTDILAESRTRFSSLDITASNDSTLSLEARMLGLASPSMRFDTITFDIAQRADRLNFTGRVENRPGSFDEWAHVRLNGFLANNTLGFNVEQQNIKGQVGYRIGANIILNDSTVTLSLDPTNPMIGYMPWTINKGNFINYSFAHKHIDADLRMKSAVSSLDIYTHHVEGQDENHQEELTVDLSDIKLGDWIKLNPFAPAIDGNLSAKINLGMDDGNINGKGDLNLADFTYGKQRVGTIDTSLDVTTSPSGSIRALADLSVDGVRALTLEGALNDSTAGSPLAMDLSLIRFPLATVNPFLPAGVASLSGCLNGSMDVRGTGDAPRLEGWLQFDSTAVKVGMIGTEYKFNDVRIPVNDNVVRFNNFAISGTNENPLTINGTVDIQSISDPDINLTLSARNMQFCNTNRLPKGADIYGKGFITLNSTVKGNMQFMKVNANVTVNSGTNITYVIPDGVSTLENQSNSDMVKFVNFADTAAVMAADELAASQMALMLEATLTVQSGSTINVDLSSNGRDKVSIQPEGTLDFSMLPFGEPRLTGRINIPKGFARYTPPILSEKYFTFDPSSYVAFNGEIMNPTLNIKAVDVIKANVTQSGQNSRLVNFDVILDVTGTLDRMDIGFDLATDDDMTVANELQSMSKEQRANQAMNMLLYGIYSGAGTTGNGNLSNNAVYSFLASQLNNWAASNIKGVDLTFGIDQYDRTYNGATSTTTSYSYQVSKSLFNDRFKIVVGGNYSTDANAEENFSQNLIKDISFDYYLNAAQTMYIRIFRHTGYESILEGEVTRTGVGFVYKRKMASLRNFFPRRRKKHTGRIPEDPGHLQSANQK